MTAAVRLWLVAEGAAVALPSAVTQLPVSVA